MEDDMIMKEEGPTKCGVSGLKVKRAGVDSPVVRAQASPKRPRVEDTATSDTSSSDTTADRVARSDTDMSASDGHGDGGGGEGCQNAVMEDTDDNQPSSPRAGARSEAFSEEEDDSSGDEGPPAPNRHTAAGRLLLSLELWLKLHQQRHTSPTLLLDILRQELGLESEVLAAIQDVQDGEPEDRQRLLWRLVRRLKWLHELRNLEGPTPRKKLAHVNSLDDVVRCVRNARRIIVLTGAGISVSCGIPDFRSENGLYSMLGEYNLPSPQAMFDIQYFRHNPVPFFKFSRELLPGRFTPSPTHRFLRLLDARGTLLRNYTQNIDGLEKQAGVAHAKVHQCHGHFDTATCLNPECRRKVPLSEIEHDVREQRIPRCGRCGREDAILKPDIVFFGEPLSDSFRRLIIEDREACDLVLVMGSSLQVAPVNHIIGWVPPTVPQVLINREVVGRPHRFDVELLGDCDVIVQELCNRLGADWQLGEGATRPEEEAMDGEAQQAPVVHEEVAPNTYLFVNGKRPASRLGQLELLDLPGLPPPLSPTHVSTPPHDPPPSPTKSL